MRTRRHWNPFPLEQANSYNIESHALQLPARFLVELYRCLLYFSLSGPRLCLERCVLPGKRRSACSNWSLILKIFNLWQLSGFLFPHRAPSSQAYLTPPLSPLFSVVCSWGCISRSSFSRLRSSRWRDCHWGSESSSALQRVVSWSGSQWLHAEVTGLRYLPLGIR